MKLKSNSDMLAKVQFILLTDGYYWIVLQENSGERFDDSKKIASFGA